MDWFRGLLVVAIGVLGWNIIFQWNQDYGQTASVYEAKDSISGAGDTSIVPGVLEPTNTKSQQGEGINSELAPVKSAATPTGIVTSTSTQLISIETDVFKGQIDLKGGDIVELALKQYPSAVEQPENPFIMLINNDQAKYIAESGIIGVSALDLDAPVELGRPIFTTPRTSYKMTDQSLVVSLGFENELGVKFEKRYVFTKGSYQIQVEYVVTNNASESWVGRPYGRLRRTGFADPSESGGFGLPTFLGVAYWDPEERFTKIDFDDIADSGTQKAYLSKSIDGGWIGMLQHYFVAAWAPSDQTNNLYRATYNESAALPGGREYVVDAVLPQVSVEPGKTETITQSLYVGPKLQENLKQVAEGLNLVVDYGPLFFISDLLMWILGLIYSVVGNYGVSIILLTLTVKLSLLPLSAKGYKSMARMREMQPKMVELKKKHGDDRQKMSEELMKMYQKEGVNPLGGCLPMLLQMPVFLALYWALLESVELRQAPFIFWIKDLSIMDPYFALPLLMGVSMWFQQRLNPEPPDPMQAKVMKFMPIGMTFLFLFFPAGLVLYWVTNNVLSITQQAYITKKIEKASAASRSTS